MIFESDHVISHPLSLYHHIVSNNNTFLKKVPDRINSLGRKCPPMLILYEIYQRTVKTGVMHLCVFRFFFV